MRTSKATSTAGALLILALCGCSVSKPPQSGFYCLEVPSGRSSDVPKVIQATSDRLHFKVSDQTSEFSPGDIHRSYELNGQGVSVFIQTSIKSGAPDEFGNQPTAFNPNRYSVQAVKTGWKQTISFGEALDAVTTAARSNGMRLTKAPAGGACAI